MCASPLARAVLERAARHPRAAPAHLAELAEALAFAEARVAGAAACDLRALLAAPLPPGGPPPIALAPAEPIDPALFAEDATSLERAARVYLIRRRCGPAVDGLPRGAAGRLWAVGRAAAEAALAARAGSGAVFLLRPSARPLAHPDAGALVLSLAPAGGGPIEHRLARGREEALAAVGGARGAVSDGRRRVARPERATPRRGPRSRALAALARWVGAAA